MVKRVTVSSGQRHRTGCEHRGNRMSSKAPDFLTAAAHADSAGVIHRKPAQKPTRKLGKPQEHTMEEDDT